MNYSTLYEYKLFLLEEYEDKIRFDRYLQEALLLESGEATCANIQALNESVVDKIKGIIQKIGTVIMNLFNKFIAKADALFKNEKDYIDKYKDIIYGRKFKGESITMYDYQKGLQNCIDTVVPVLDMTDKNFLDAANDEDPTALQELVFRNKFHTTKNDDTFKERVLTFLRGSANEIIIKGPNIKIADMANFCKTYNTVYKAIKKDQQNLNSACDTAIKNISSREDPTKKEETNESADIFNESFYSVIYGRYITEADGTEQSKPTEDTNADEKKNSPDPEITFASVNKNVGTDENDTHKTEIDDTAVEGKSNAQLEAAVKGYLKVCGEFIGCKMQVLEEAFKCFMKIIRAHVESYQGDKEAKNAVKNKTANNAEGYKNPFAADATGNPANDESNNTESI